MKRSILLVGVILMALLAGCTFDEPGHVIIHGKEDGTYAPVKIDATTGGILAITNIQHEINEGNTYYSYDVTDLGNGANRTILLDTLNTTREVHFYWVVNMELEATVRIYEDALVSSAGTTLPVYNRKRDSDNINETLIRHTPTVTSSGLLIYEAHLAAGGKAGGTDNPLDEIILKRGTRYTMVVTNQTTNNNVVSGKMIWYEHTPGAE